MKVLRRHFTLFGTRCSVAPPVHFRMASAHEIAEQISNCRLWFASQVGAGLEESSRDTTINGMCRSFVTQISALRSLDIIGATELNNVIASSPFPAPLKSQLAAAVAHRAMNVQSAGKTVNDTQLLETPLAYFTTKDWEALESGKTSKVQKIHVVSQRCRLINLSNPSEKTQRGLAAIVASVLWPTTQPSPHDLWSVVLDLKESLRWIVCDEFVPRLAVFPATPDQMPPALMARAYSATDPPCPRHSVSTARCTRR